MLTQPARVMDRMVHGMEQYTIYTIPPSPLNAAFSLSHIDGVQSFY